MPRKVVKKAKKSPKKLTRKRSRHPKASTPKDPRAKALSAKPIGRVTHFYGGIKVAVVKFSKDAKKGTAVRFEGATTKFSQKLESMQYDHKAIAKAPKGKQVGVKVKKRVREGDKVYLEK